MSYRLVPKSRYKWQLPLELKFDRYGCRVAIVLILQPPITKYIPIDIDPMQGWSGILDDET